MEKENIIKYFKNMKGKWFLLSALLLGILLIIISNIPTQKELSGVLGECKEGNSLGILSFEEYRKELEESVQILCHRVRGSGEVSVLLTLESGGELVYAQNIGKDAAGEQKTEYIVSSGSAGAGGLLLKERYPAVCGIAVVCSGGGNTSVKKEITDLLAAAFNLPTNRIYVASGE